MNKIIAIIPARMNSSRFPGKPLAPILGRPMIEHVYRRASLCAELYDVIVATPDEEIKNAVEGFGGKALMTSSAHERASDRTAEATEKLGTDIIVMIQGDEPMITPGMISESLAPMIKDSSIDCVNLAYPITEPTDFNDFNTVKTVMNLAHDAVYFSRAPIPLIDITGKNAPPVYKQVCVIPFRYNALMDFAALSPTPLEQAESIDMLRFIEYGRRIRLVETKTYTQAVDTPSDLARVERLLADDLMIREYLDFALK